jgi:hypothetical protein
MAPLQLENNQKKLKRLKEKKKAVAVRKHSKEV